jgi:hypothetical protein
MIFRLQTLTITAVLLFSVTFDAFAAPQTLQPFSTDGCSLFPDRSLIGKEDWYSCCLAHDLAYWRGGTAEERLNADQALQACVEKSTNSKALADLMYAGVRSGGGPYFFTTYRWAYGWPYGRFYQPLTKDEQESVLKLEREYRKSAASSSGTTNQSEN